MLTLHNKSKRMLVFKHIDRLPMRLIPGQNNVDMTKEQIASYLQNTVSKASFQENITFVNGDQINFKEAEAAKTKSDRLNHDYKKVLAVNKKISATVDKKDLELKQSDKKIEGLEAKIEKLTKLVEESAKQKTDTKK